MHRRHKLLNIGFLFLSLFILNSCGGNDCRYPEKSDGIWDDIAPIKVFPINQNIVVDLNDYGGFSLKNGYTELKARENLWVPLQLDKDNGGDVIVEAGNKVELKVSNSVILSGYLQTIPVLLKEWINPAQTPYAFSNVVKTKGEISNKVPNSIDVVTTFNPDGSKDVERTYYVKYGDREVAIRDKDSNLTNTGQCTTQAKSTWLNETVNYAFLYPKKIVFSLFPTIINGVITGGVSYNTNIVITPEEHNLKCTIKQEVYAVYSCTFLYQNINFEYKRRVKPVIQDYYPQFEEQINCLDNEVQIENAGANVSYKNNHHYLICLVGGPKTSSDFCRAKNTPFDNVLYTAIIGVKGSVVTSTGQTSMHSPIKFYFKNNKDMTFANNTSLKTYNNQACFQSPSSYYENNTAMSGGQYINNRFSSKFRDIRCSSTNGSSTLKHHTLCRMFPKRISYKIKKYKPNGFTWVSRDNSNDSEIISFCSKDCLDACTTYFPLKKDAKWDNDVYRDYYFYYYGPVDSLPAQNTTGPTLSSVGCSCTRTKHFIEATKRRTTELQDIITKMCQKEDGWYGWYATADVTNGKVLNYTFQQPVPIQTDLSYFTLVKFIRSYNNEGGSYQHKEVYNGTGGNYLSYYLCSPYSVNMGLCDYEGLRQCNPKNMGGGKCQGIGGFKFIINVKTMEKVFEDFKNDNGSLIVAKDGTNGNGASYRTYSSLYPNNSQKENYRDCLVHNDSSYALHLADDRRCDIEYMVSLNTEEDWYDCNSAHYTCLKKIGSDYVYGISEASIFSSKYYNKYFTVPRNCRDTTKSHKQIENVSTMHDYFDARYCDAKFLDCVWQKNKLQQSGIKVVDGCPTKCEIPIFEVVPDNEELVSVNDVNVLSRIDYTYGIHKDAMPRRGSYSSDEDNTIYYEINDGKTIKYGDNLLSIHDGLLALSSDEIYSIECYDDYPEDLMDNLFEPMDSYFRASSSLFDTSVCNDFKDEEYASCVMQLLFFKKKHSNHDENTFNDKCKISGSFYSYQSGSGSNLLKFYPQTQGIIPIQWSSFAVQPGDSIPITISTSGGGALPIKIKSKTSGNYIEMFGGNGLVLYLQPNEDDDVNDSDYSSPDDWQCNMGTGGSYAFYKPYRYERLQTKDNNPREIYTTSTMWWYCNRPVAMWFSGYDYEGIKSGNSFSMHKYDWEKLNAVLPNYQKVDDSTSLEKLGCNADGIPTTMTIGGTTISRDSFVDTIINGGSGRRYQYTDSSGNLINIDVNDRSITRKTFSPFIPEVIVVDLEDLNLKNVTITKNKNNLTRITNDNIVFKYKFTYVNEITKQSKDYEIDVSSANVVLAQCLANASEQTTDTATYNNSIVLNKIDYDSNNRYYYSNDGGKTITTRFGAFTGFASYSTTKLLPAIYQVRGMCMGIKNPGSTGNGHQFVYDEQHNVYKFLWISPEGVKRLNLDRSWRVEFTTPDFEYNGNENYEGSFCTTKDALAFCDTETIPDILIVDLNKAVPPKNITAVVYKDMNDIHFVNDKYRIITCPAVGWNNKKVFLSTASISCKWSGFYDSCENNVGDDMVMEVMLNGDKKDCKVKDKDVVIGDLINERFFVFDYEDTEYKILVGDVPNTNKTCYSNKRGCQPWLREYVSSSFTKLIADKSDKYDVFSDEKHSKDLGYENHLLSLGRSPYILSCAQRLDTNVHDRFSAVKFKYPYAKTNGSPNDMVTGQEIVSSIKHEDFSSTGVEEGLILNYGISALTNSYFARCVPNWKSSKWMLLERAYDPTSFQRGFSAVSGAYFPKVGTSPSWDAIKKQYAIDKIHSKYGGIISNNLYKTTCTNGSLGVPKDCYSTVYSSANYPSFKARYEKQIILVKSLVNDPANTSDDACSFVANGSKNYGNITLIMNDPFGTQMPNSSFEEFPVDKDGALNKTTISNVSNVDIGNGNGLNGHEFFKFTETYRNLIGAGIVHPSWWSFNDSMANPAIFTAGETITIKPINAGSMYYASGNLTHASKAYCVNPDHDYSIGDVEGWWGSALTAVAVFQPIAITLASKAVDEAKSKSYKPGRMLDITKNKSYNKNIIHKNVVSHDVYKYKPTSAQRYCGVGTAFRVLPIPHFACFSGYQERCSNDRINKYVDKHYNGDDHMIAELCTPEVQTEYQARKIPVGKCYKQKFSISTTQATTDKTILRYKNSERVLNNLISATSNDWDSSENVLSEQCGACIKKKNITTYGGITYGISEIGTMSNDFVTQANCRNIPDPQTGEEYTWITQFAKLTPWDAYSTEEQEAIFNMISKKFLVKLSNCNSGLNYNPTLSNDEILNYTKQAFKYAGLRNDAQCLATLELLYELFLKEAEVDSVCHSNIQTYISTMASSACTEMLNKVKNVDGDEYEKYIFVQNASTAMCSDDKTQSIYDENTKMYSLVKAKLTENLERYGFGELSSDVVVNKDDAVSFTIDIPKTIRGQKFKTANIGFAFAGKNTNDVMNIYSDYRIKNTEDLNRGYEVQVGDGSPSMRGKYLYLYWQPLLSNGEPDPAYNPNTFFSPRTPNLNGKTYKPEEIIKSKMVYDFKTFDAEDNGEAIFIAPRTGKLWVAVIDANEYNVNGNSIDPDRDGKYILFKAGNDDPNEKTNGNNYLGSNTGYYQVEGSVQAEKLESIQDIVNGNTKSSKIGGTIVSAKNSLFSWLITELREILIGSYDATTHTYSKEEKKIEEGGKKNLVDKALNKVTSFLSFSNYKGLMPQLAGAILTQPIVYIAYWLVVVLGMFIFAFQVLLGTTKIDFELIRKYLWAYGMMAFIVNPTTLDFYLRFFAHGAFSLADGLSAYVAGNFSTATYEDGDTKSWMSLAFGPVDTILNFYLSSDTFYKMLAILFSSLTGWLSCILLVICFVMFVISSLEALIVYIMILLHMAIQLAIGPIIFLTLVHEKSAGIFTNWWKGLAGMIAEQVCMFTALSAFATLYYHILKGSLNFIICWEPVIKIPILDITLFSCWRIAGKLPMHMAEMMGEYQPESSVVNDGFSVITGFILFLITMCMSKFIDKSTNFGASLFGQKSVMPDEIKAIVKEARKFASSKLLDKGFSPYKFAGNKILDTARFEALSGETRKEEEKQQRK